MIFLEFVILTVRVSLYGQTYFFYFSESTEIALFEGLTLGTDHDFFLERGGGGYRDWEKSA